MYGLIGKNLSHSFSKEIHNAFGNQDYELINTENIQSILESKSYNGFNITIPYKTEIVKYLDYLDDVAKLTNSVNTVILKENQYYGYNTDYYGFIELIKFYRIEVYKKNVLILGNGSVSNTVVLALEELEANQIVRLSRTIKNDFDDTFSNSGKYNDFDIIINTTPVGMYPHNDDDLLINLNNFNKLVVVIDLIYNPLRTKLLLEAERNNIKAINGLYMLVMQAKKAHELYFNCDLPINLANKIYKKLLKKMYNIVFIGLPLSGKSKYAKLFEINLSKKIYDTDIEIEQVINTSIFDYFHLHSEAEFRMIESEIIKLLYKEHNCIISTGGGAIKDQKNMELLKQNGIIVFLNKNPEEIATKNIQGRPLIKNKDDVLRIAKERLPLYEKACDISIAITRDTVYHINEIKEKIDEYLNY
jgi:shikimate dehydrogenase